MYFIITEIFYLALQLLKKMVIMTDRMFEPKTSIKLEETSYYVI